MSSPERHSFDGPKRTGVQFILPDDMHPLWQRVSDALDNRLIAGFSLKDLRPRMLPNLGPISMHALSNTFPVGPVELAIFSGYEKTTKFSYRLAGKLHFDSADLTEGSGRIIQQQKDLAAILKARHVSVSTPVPEDAPLSITLSSLGETVLSFMPMPNSTEKTWGGFAILTGVKKSGSQYELAHVFPLDIHRFLVAAAYLTDGLAHLYGQPHWNHHIKFQFDTPTGE
jgi:hypothetical protein